MVDTVKQDGEVSIAYMKWFEHDQMLLEEGREEERKNTEIERLRADAAESRANSAESLSHSLSEKLRLYEKTYGKLSIP